MLVFDAETDGLIPAMTKIHCINMLDRSTGERARYNDQPLIVRVAPTGTIAAGVARLQKQIDDGGMIAGQNLLGFDKGAIQKLFPDFTAPVEQMVDTFIISRLIWADIGDIDRRALARGRRSKEFKELGLTGRHSLEAWGWRLGYHKGDYATMRKAEAQALGLEGAELDHFVWGTFTAEMDDYCAEDCEVTNRFIDKIEAEDYSPEAIRLEHRVAEIIALQETHGFYFDVPAAERLTAELTGDKAELEDELRTAFPPWFEPERKFGAAVVMDPKKKRSAKVEMPDGSIIKSSYEPGAAYTKVKLVSFEPGSRDRIANRLITLFGWVPTEFTPKGKPEVSETTLSGLEYPQAKLLIRYLTIDKVLGTVSGGQKAWLRKVGPDSRIHSRVNSNGAITGRMTHADHMAQVPKIKFDEAGNKLRGFDGGYGMECRALFVAAPGRALVGVDADGLELRELGHYMARFDGGTFATAVVEGDKKLGTDAHSLNMKFIGLATRDGAKTWMYAYIYGAGDFKLGMIFYEDMPEAWRDRFNAKHAPGNDREKALMRIGRTGRTRIEAGLPALKTLQKQVKAAAKTVGTITSHDGRKLTIRAQHSALNTLLQGGGAIVMKKALVLTYDAFLAEGWVHGREFAFVANVHDEFQMEVHPDHTEKVGQIAADAIQRAGEAFSLRCPLAGSAASGRTWADTH